MIEALPKSLIMPRALHGFEHITRYWDKLNNVFAAKILPGEFYVTVEREVIVTVLGSCVSACIRDPVFGIGGMNHFMLPLSAEAGVGDVVGSATRYGNFAMEHMINELLKNGARRENLEVKIVGGGRVLQHMTDIGLKNIRFVREYIRMEGLKLVGEDVGDVFPRKVHYDPATGKVRVKKLKSLHNDTVLAREEAYRRDIEQQAPVGEIDLF